MPAMKVAMKAAPAMKSSKKAAPAMKVSAKGMKVVPMKAAAMKAVMKKSTKAMKASVMKKVMKKAKKVSIKGKKWQVMNDSREKTVGGLTKADLILNAHGKAVSKKQHAKGKALAQMPAAKKWMAGVAKARAALGITGFCAVNSSKHPMGKTLYAKAKSFYMK